jgi:hypothetical protein
VSAERKPELYVVVWVGDLTTGGGRRIPAARSSADERGGRDAVVEASEDDTELTATFVLMRSRKTKRAEPHTPCSMPSTPTMAASGQSRCWRVSDPIP